MLIKKNLKYVFVDVVNYTRKSQESQLDIVLNLQSMVSTAARELKLISVISPSVYFIPTGDGMCIVIDESRTDIHLRLAIRIKQLLIEHNIFVSNKVKPGSAFELRIGLNENEDLRYEDINSNLNFAGPGINLAQRTMSLGRPMEIVVTTKVHQNLFNTADYDNRFILRRLEKPIKNTDIDSIYILKE